MKMSKCALIVIFLLINCTDQGASSNAESTKKNSNSLDSNFSLRDTNTKNISHGPNAQKTNRKASRVDSVVTCNDLLVSLIMASSFDPKVKKFKFKVWVDESSDQAVILKITLRNTERNEDLVISWLKLDIAKKKLLDITTDPNNPMELKYDTMLFKKVIKGCKF